MRQPTDEDLQTMTIVSIRNTAPPKTAPETTAVGKCDDCGHEVWVAGSSQKLMARAARRGIVLPVNCVECALPKMEAEREKHGDVGILGPDRDQLLADIKGEKP